MAIFDFPTTFLTNTFVFQIFVPFIILFAILWGLLEAIKIFESSKVKLVIALGFSLVASFTNPWILAYIAALGAYMAVVLFGILFLFGVIRWGLSRGHDIYFETSSYRRQIEKLAKEKAKLEEKLQKPGLKQAEGEVIYEKIKKLEAKIHILQARL
jgi:hypothetical protein